MTLASAPTMTKKQTRFRSGYRGPNAAIDDAAIDDAKVPHVQTNTERSDEPGQAPLPVAGGWRY